VVSTLPDVGVALPLGYNVAPSHLSGLAARAEERGLGGVQLGELAGTEAFALAATLAARTSRTRLETAVVATVTRSPALLAMGAATLAELSGGRFVLGLGLGSPIVAEWHGTQFPDRPRSAVLGTLHAVRAALAGERLSGHGGFRLSGIAPQPDAKLFLAAINERMITAAGRYADGVVVNFCTPERAATLVPLAVGAAAAAGRRIEFVANLWAFAGNDAETAERRLRWEIAPYLAVPAYRAAAISVAGVESVDRAGQAWREGGRAAAAPLVPQQLIDGLLVHGDAGQIETRLAGVHASGIDTVRLVPLTSLGGGLAAAHDLVDLLGDVVHAPVGRR
jgi:alkanesulfonate monooxygenase SsuD/methylene tetrahydromethanopterin reductase-like flavin-dependent oxidoreductase (luciferase family)